VILWLGDSYAFGHGVDYEESFIGRADAETPEARHVNAAVAGYGPVQYRQVLEFLVEQGLHFDLLMVVSFVGNDFHDVMRSKDRAVVAGVIGHRGDLKSYVKMNSHLYRLLASVFHRFSTREVSPYQKDRDQLATPAAWDEDFLARAHAGYVEEMSKIQQLARSRGAEAVFVVLPTREAVQAIRGGQDPDSVLQPVLPVERARGVFEEIPADVVDTTSALSRFAPDEVYFRFDGHLNLKGNRVVAEALLEGAPLSCPTAEPGPR